MPMVKNVEKRIWDLEGFAVVICHGDGRDMRGDATGIPAFPLSRAAKNSMTVADWKAQRFYPNYPGLEVDILDVSGSPVPGNTLLATVRDTYAEE